MRMGLVERSGEFGPILIVPQSEPLFKDLELTLKDAGTAVVAVAVDAHLAQVGH